MSGVREGFRWTVPALIWAVLVLVGVVLLVFGPGRGVQSKAVAARFLPMNTLLLPGDLVLEGYTGRYVVAPNGVEHGKALRPEDVADQPVLPIAPPVELLLLLPVPRAAVAGGVNAGSKVQLCGKAPVEFGSVTVRLVRCDSNRPAASCSAVVVVPDSVAGDLAAKGLKDQTSSGELHLAHTCG